MNGLEILATGRGIPGNVVTNDDLSKIVDTNDEWISTRTGIKCRQFCGAEETNWQLALQAAETAIHHAKIDRKEIGLLIVATFTPDYATPSIACILQKELGLSHHIIAFDLNAACSGFLYGIGVAHSMMQDVEKPYALVIGSEQISSRLNMEDRNTCVLFGDGAGAVILKKSDKKFYSVLGAEGNVDILNCDKNGVFMDGKTVFKTAVRTIPHIAEKLLIKSGLTMDDVDYVVCHQANLRIIKSVIKQLNAPEEKFYINIERYGNTSAASIPIALDEMKEKGMLAPGKKIMCVGFGAGVTYGGFLMEL